MNNRKSSTAKEAREMKFSSLPSQNDGGKQVKTGGING